MSINLSFKILLSVVFLSGFSVAAAGKIVGGNNDLAPEATAADAKISVRDLPYLEKAFIDTTPADRKDAVQVGELGVDGGNSDMIVKLAEEIAESKHSPYDSLLITYKGKLLFESYYRRGRVNLPHGQASAVKAYTSLILGRAIQLGYLTMADLNKPLVSFLKDLEPTKFVKGVEKITLHKALTMHGGLRISEAQNKELKTASSKLKGQGFVQSLLEHSKPITSDSQIYKYGNYNPGLVMQVIDAVVPGSAQEFIKKELLDKMGIVNYHWKDHTVSGLPESGWRVRMTSRDMVKLGSLLLNKGKWQGDQLISADYLAKATSSITTPTGYDWMPKNYFYGYFFYQTDITIGDKSYSASWAWGGGGQFIITVEELDLSIVITGHDRDEEVFLSKVYKRILPAFSK
ncbi:serine hydrolase domain-containing protein [Colwellia psychrerythraea]|uniref:Beta-lactamase n=1 Tax=Colwellia psychrerythraea TaxID=28229 RepID=A0A099KJ01_COLPS|nr:serine hydrolase domain-containing protein [Colwellia psychrerythraea]KGJ90386.1 beta-lactamase [Colwellia psychrerythraea]